ncbi:HNH endonuclease [Dactylosporangium sp. McL0621]|uniref:HNH endonuclease n=1 Tax=Dactylosporangium sp. McL0621 TaxID=3415678 RepID=UPI003CEE3F3A
MAAEVTHWLYPINAESEYVLIDPESEDETVASPENLLQGIEEHPERVDQWVLRTGYRKMRENDAVWVYAGGQRQALVALARVVEVYPDEDEVWQVGLLWDRQATRALTGPHPLFRRQSFTQFPQIAAVRADADTTTVLEQWLKGRGIGLGDPDAGDDLSLEDARLRVVAAIVRRQGQGDFRARLFQAYGDNCVVTGSHPRAVLEAAHIEPYRGPHSNDLRNGLLLRADLHSLFDLHLVGFDSAGRLEVSKQLSATPYWKMRGTQLRAPVSGYPGPLKRRLAAHLKQLES